MPLPQIPIPSQGTSMPAFLLPAAGAVANFAGGFLGGKEQSKQSEADRKLQREFGRRSAGLQEGATAVGLQRQLDTAPLRNDLLNILSARAGAPIGEFKGRDLFNPNISSEVPQLGGVDFAAMAEATRQGTGANAQQFVNTQVPQEVIDRLMNPGKLVRNPENVGKPGDVSTDRAAAVQAMMAKINKIFGR